ncbi:Hint domain-containing homing endonuclease [Stutzerimonas nitrititolerans]|uniref:Hint domain-containing homing endonuclease n=1 Tax=Stutzerimonas nitrititolerans TaxID=2482751 RepID=UPI0028B1CEB3|nr:Hint domain-containing homing endonuclease [Stutzerimonas nitrititolerans]
MARKLTILEDSRYDAFVERYHADPLRFAVEVCGVEPSDDQADLYAEMADPMAKVSVVSGTGCFAAGTQMMRASGEAVAVENIRAGDRLMGPDGDSVRNVLELKRGREPMYRFTYVDGTSHVFNESHILCLVNTYDKNGRKAGDLCNVTVREYLTWNKTKRRSHSIYRSAVERFERPAAPLSVPAYVLGVWLGDGDSRQPSITTSDMEIDDAFTAFALSLGCTVSRATNSTNSWFVRAARVVGTSQANPVVEALRTAGVWRNKHIPDAYRFASLEDRLELLAGLIDTDGHFDAGSGGYDFVQKCERMARDVAWLARSVGCHATYRQISKTCVNNGVSGLYWRVTIGRGIEKIPVRLARKQCDGRNRQRPNLHFSIKSVEPLGEGDYYGFVLDGDSRFLGYDFTVLHNTGKTMTFGRIALWSLLCHPYAIYGGKVEIGSNTYIGAPLVQQVGDGVWKEMQDAKISICNGPVAWVAQYFNITKTRVVVNGFEDQWFIAQIALAKGQSVGVAGKHRYWQLIIIDEAAGVPDDHFNVIDGTQTQPGNRTLMASQGVRPSGRFYDSHHRLSHRNGGAWRSLCFSSVNSPFVTSKWLREREIETGGKDSVEYQIRVLGRFPEQTDKYMLGRSAIECQIEAAPVIRDDEPYGHMLVIDVGAGVYRDKTVCTHLRVIGNGDRLDMDPRRADIVDIPVFSNSLDWTDVAGRVKDYALQLSNPTLVVDVGGQGEQFARLLERAGLTNIVRVNWGTTNFKKKYKERFYNRRAQCIKHASEAVQDRRITFIRKHEKDLLDQGSRIPYHFDEKTRIHIMPKEKMAEEGLPSPDLWDTVCMAFLEESFYIQAQAQVSATANDRRANARARAKAAMGAEQDA